MKKWLIAVVPIILILGIIIIMVFQNRMDVKVMREYGKNTEKIKDIPRSYYNKAENGGKLEEFYYDTFESKTYNEKSRKIIKRAIVYTPHDYDENNEYDIFYLMHGGWSNERASLGTPDNPGAFKNVIDNAIANGEIKPIIIVCPTYNNESSDDSADLYTCLLYFNSKLS